MRLDTIIVGAGFAGAFSAFWLSQRENVLFIGESLNPTGASVSSAGLVNPFAGLRSRLIWRGLEALEDLEALLELTKTVYHVRGIARPAAGAEQVEHFRAAAKAFPGHLEWLGSGEFRERFPAIVAHHGGLINQCGGAIGVEAFLASVYKSVAWHIGTFKFGSPVTAWDQTRAGVTVTTARGRRYKAKRLLLCLGSGYAAFNDLQALNLHQTKGQTAHLLLPRDDLIPMPVVHQGYIVPGPNSLHVGTTYEHDFASNNPTRGTQQALIARAAKVVPGIARLLPIGSTAGIRVGVPGTRLPMLGQIAPNVWVFTGLGSKGLLFAAHLSRRLHKYFADPSLVPPELGVKYKEFKPS